MSSSFWPHRLYNPWNSPDQDTGVSSHFLLQGIFPTQGSNPSLLYYRQVLYQLSYQGSPKKAEHRGTDAFKLWCWRRLLRVLWTARRSNQSILKEINLEYSLEGLMLKLKLQYFGHLTWRLTHWKIRPDAGKDWRQEEKGETEDEMVRWHHWLNGHEFEQILGDNEGQGRLVCCSPQGCEELEAT